jgi:hypothetical protein
MSEPSKPKPPKKPLRPFNIRTHGDLAGNNLKDPNRADKLLRKFGDNK